MFKNILKVLLLLAIGAISFASYAGGPDQWSSDGRPGQTARVPQDNEFKVCADPNNMPYSNSNSEGFENKIAEVLADDLGRELSFQFWPDRFGFIRNTIKANRCDVIIGTNTTYDALNTTKPYYRAGHVWIYRKDSGYKIDNWDSPDLRKGVIGIVDKSPVAQALNANNLMANAKPYRLMRDLTKSPGQLVDHVVSGEIDVAIMWGPIGGYYAKQSKEDLVVVLIPEYSEGNEKLTGKTYWNISAGVRKKDDERRDMIEAALIRNKDKIRKIMDDFGVPYTDPVFGDRLDGYKRHKN
jgi:mxaJ protein